MLKAYAVIVAGKVQGVGFRRAVQQLAKKNSIVGTVNNLEDGNVEILVQGEENDIDSFLAASKDLEAPIKVEGFEKPPRRKSAKLKPFKIKYGELPART